MYVTSAQGRINAIRADTGELLWEFDSKLPEDALKYGPDANRGAAVYKDRVIWCNIIISKATYEGGINLSSKANVVSYPEVYPCPWTYSKSI